MTTTTVSAPVSTHLHLGQVFRPVLTALKFTGHFLLALLSVIFLGSAAEH